MVKTAELLPTDDIRVHLKVEANPLTGLVGPCCSYSSASEQQILQSPTSFLGQAKVEEGGGGE